METDNAGRRSAVLMEMKMTKNNGAPAFPVTAGQTVYSHGMMLRDWFAGQALAGLLACGGSASWEQDAANAYAAADAMLAARQGGEA